MIESVKKLRSRINAADSPVLYKWWFKYDKRIWDKFGTLANFRGIM